MRNDRSDEERFTGDLGCNPRCSMLRVRAPQRSAPDFLYAVVYPLLHYQRMAINNFKLLHAKQEDIIKLCTTAMSYGPTLALFMEISMCIPTVYHPLLWSLSCTHIVHTMCTWILLETLISHLAQLSLESHGSKSPMTLEPQRHSL